MTALSPTANEDLERALTDLRGARNALLSVVAALTPDDLQRSRRGGWTIARVLEHVIESEQIYAKLLAHLCARTAPETSAPGARSVEVVQQQLMETRSAVLAMIDGVDEDTLYRLTRVGHEEYSTLSGLENVALHDREHRDQIEELLAASAVAGAIAARDVLVRRAEERDLPRLTEIYNHYVLNTATTFDTEPYTIDQRREWASHYAPKGRHRLLVAERDGVVLGHASTSRFHPRAAYDTTVELTALCAPEAVGQGIGQRLYEELFESIRGEDVHVAMALITLPNRGSCALHERFGFRRAMVVREVGRKFGKWWDVAWYEKRMDKS